MLTRSRCIPSKRIRNWKHGCRYIKLLAGCSRHQNMALALASKHRTRALAARILPSSTALLSERPSGREALRRVLPRELSWRNGLVRGLSAFALQWGCYLIFWSITSENLQVGLSDLQPNGELFDPGPGETMIAWSLVPAVQSTWELSWVGGRMVELLLIGWNLVMWPL
jgi:hypothetical protein